MALHVRVEPVEKVVQARLRADLSPEARQKESARFAKAGIDEATATNRRILGRDPPRTITVDGVKNARLESVNPDHGNITAEWELVDGLLRWIGDTLIERSPHLSGAYKRGHTLYADGAEVPIGGRIPPADEYVFTNLVPYARRLEVGKTKSGRPFLIEVPNKIYQRTADDARKEFGKTADITLSWRDMVGAAPKPSIGRKDRRRGATTAVSPAIVIRYRKD